MIFFACVALLGCSKEEKDLDVQIEETAYNVITTMFTGQMKIYVINRHLE